MKYLLWILLVFLVFFRYQQTKPVYKEGDMVRISSKVTSEPTVYETAQGIRLAQLWVYLPSFPKVSYGDYVVVEGVVSKGKLKNAKLVEHRESNSQLFKARSRLVSFYKKYLPEPHSSLVAGMVLGSKSSMPTTFWDKLKKSGTAHVVVASGMNVTLIAQFLMGLFILFLPRRQAIPAALGGIWIYALVSGMDAPIVRAAIMGSIAFSAQSFGRLAFAWRTLVITAAVMLLVNPGWIFDLGFILSFGATASILAFEKNVRGFFKFVPGLFQEGLSTSLSAQILVAPILYASFGSFSPLSPLANAFVLWTVPFVTIIGGLMGILGLILPSLAGVLLLIVYPFTFWFVKVIEVFS